MEQAGCAGGDAPSGPGANAKTHSLARRLRVRPRQPDTRAASGPALGVLRPLREELAATAGANASPEARTGAEKCRKRSAARRARCHAARPRLNRRGWLRLAVLRPLICLRDANEA